MTAEIWSATDRFFSQFGSFLPIYPFSSYWAIFCPFTPLTAQKMKMKAPGDTSFYTIAPKIIIIGYTVPEIWLLKAQKIKFLK